MKIKQKKLPFMKHIFEPYMSGNNRQNFEHVPSVPQPLKTGQEVKFVSAFILSLAL